MLAHLANSRDMFIIEEQTKGRSALPRRTLVQTYVERQGYL